MVVDGAYGETAYEEEEEQEEEVEEGITSEDCWTVIQSFFDSKGLVSQQMDSFDDFAVHTIQELINENSTLTLGSEQPTFG